MTNGPTYTILYSAYTILYIYYTYIQYKVKGGIVSQKCLACGHKDTVDMTHKLTTFILAQHKACTIQYTTYTIYILQQYTCIILCSTNIYVHVCVYTYRKLKNPVPRPKKRTKKPRKKKRRIKKLLLLMKIPKLPHLPMATPTLPLPLLTQSRRKKSKKIRNRVPASKKRPVSSSVVYTQYYTDAMLEYMLISVYDYTAYTQVCLINAITFPPYFPLISLRSRADSPVP